VSDNSTADPGAGGDTFRTKDRAGIKTEIVGLDLTPAGGSETLMNGVMPVSDNSGSLTVDNAGTFAVQADTELTTADLDAGAGTDTRAVVGLVVAKSGGAANVSSVDPLPVSIASSVSVTSSSDRAEDTVAVSGHSGTPVLGVRNDSAAAKTSTDGDYSMLATDDAGRVGVTDLGGAISVDDNGGSLTVDNGGTFAVQADTELTTSDLDTGAGTDTRAVVGIALAASGGAVLAGSANPVPISDNSGSLTVDGTVTANAGTGPFPVSDNGGSITVDAAAASFAVNSARRSPAPPRRSTRARRTLVRSASSSPQTRPSCRSPTTRQPDGRRARRDTGFRAALGRLSGDHDAPRLAGGPSDARGGHGADRDREPHASHDGRALDVSPRVRRDNERDERQGERGPGVRVVHPQPRAVGGSRG
jgi:hypothetical protein